MKTQRLGESALMTSRLAYGCWRVTVRGTSEDLERGRRAVIQAFEAGYTLFDHADMELTREEWYRLLEAARGERLP